MARVIWKFPLEPGSTSVDMPQGATVISAGVDPNGAICVWAEVDHDEEKRAAVRFDVVPTGREVPAGEAQFIGTAVDMDCGLVWHIYRPAPNGKEG